MKVKFKKEEEEEQTQYMEQYFRENKPQVFNGNDDENEIEEYFDNIFEKINGKIEVWVAEGSGWEVEKNRACVRECSTFSATAWRNICANSNKVEKQKSSNERAK